MTRLPPSPYLLDSLKNSCESVALLRSPYSPSGILRQALPKRRADRTLFSLIPGSITNFSREK